MIILPEIGVMIQQIVRKKKRPGLIKSSRPEVFCKKVFLEISQKACNFIKKETLAQVFSCEFCQISSWWLLLFNVHFQYSQSKTTALKGSVLIFYFKNG